MVSVRYDIIAREGRTLVLAMRIDFLVYHALNSILGHSL